MPHSMWCGSYCLRPVLNFSRVKRSIVHERGARPEVLNLSSIGLHGDAFCRAADGRGALGALSQETSSASAALSLAALRCSSGSWVNEVLDWASGPRQLLWLGGAARRAFPRRSASSFS
eukprot:scaffold70981_cov32-Tisochrysis_lutea.AAC.1